MSQEQMVKPSDRVNAIAKMFKVNRDRIVRAIPRSVVNDPSRLLSIAYNSIVFNEDLIACTQRSLLGGVMEALKLGITIGGPMQESWLLPFKNRKKVKDASGKESWETVLEATLIIGYQGYRNIIDRGGSTIDMQSHAVALVDAKDPMRWDYQQGSAPFVRHKPTVTRPATKAEMWGAYTVFRLRKGGIQICVMDLEEIERHRARSRAKDTGPWSHPNDYVPMGIKTTIRDAAKYVPKSSELLSRALDLDERADKGEDQHFEIPDDAEFFEMEGRVPGTPDRLKVLNEKLTDELDPLKVAREQRERERVTAASVPGELKLEDIGGFHKEE